MLDGKNKNCIPLRICEINFRPWLESASGAVLRVSTPAFLLETTKNHTQVFAPTVCTDSNYVCAARRLCGNENNDPSSPLSCSLSRSFLLHARKHTAPVIYAGIVSMHTNHALLVAHTHTPLARAHTHTNASNQPQKSAIMRRVRNAAVQADANARRARVRLAPRRGGRRRELKYN